MIPMTHLLAPFLLVAALLAHTHAETPAPTKSSIPYADDGHARHVLDI